MGREFLMLVLRLLNFFLTVYSNAEGDALIAFMSSLSDAQVLGSWNAIDVNPCRWFHVTCNNHSSVTRLDLGNANLSGHLVPQLGSLPNLQYLELSSNNITGEIPCELGKLKSLVSLDLHQNKLSGPIPDELGKLLKLRFLRLNNNSLSGKIPMYLTSINSLELLNLSFNNLSGIIPQNGSFALFKHISFEGNPYLKTATPSSSQSIKHARAILIYTAGAIVLLAALSIAFVWWRRRKHRVHFFDPQAKEDCEVHLGQLKRFSLKELQAATNNFHHKNFVGRGGFGEVYKGSLADGSLVAVKRLRVERTQGEELRFQTELQMISMAVHRNLIQLQGFCMTNTERLLVYPSIANGSVASCLRALEGSQPLLDWPKRKQIALGSARGLAYLHHQCDPKIIHRDVKAASILLDEEFEAVVGDFGLAKLMGYTDTHVTTVVCGTTGHIAPEYFYSGKCSEKTDVFGYGVMLLELITGQQVLDLVRLLSDNVVTVHDWVKGLVKDKKLQVLVDVNMQGNYIQEELEQLIQISLLCTQSSSLERPNMSQVVNMLEGDGLGERWEEWQQQKVLYQEFNHDCRPNGGWIADSTSNLRPDELSGPR